MAELDVEKLNYLVFTALGEASMCWEHVDRTGVFQSERAKEIGGRLVAAIKPTLEDRDRLRAIGQRITTTLQEDHWVVVDELRAALEGHEPT